MQVKFNYSDIKNQVEMMIRYMISNGYNYDIKYFDRVLITLPRYDIEDENIDIEISSLFFDIVFQKSV